jgi:hypothetical protein
VAGSAGESVKEGNAAEAYHGDRGADPMPDGSALPACALSPRCAQGPARAIAACDGIKGPICVFATIEACWSFGVAFQRDRPAECRTPLTSGAGDVGTFTGFGIRIEVRSF